MYIKRLDLENTELIVRINMRRTSFQIENTCGYLIVHEVQSVSYTT